MPSHDQPVYYDVQATIKMQAHHKESGVGLAARAEATWLHLHDQTWISLLLEKFVIH